MNFRDYEAARRALENGLDDLLDTVREAVEDSIRLLDCGEDTERTMPDVVGALEALREAQEELRG